MNYTHPILHTFEPDLEHLNRTIPKIPTQNSQWSTLDAYADTKCFFSRNILPTTHCNSSMKLWLQYNFLFFTRILKHDLPPPVENMLAGKRFSNRTALVTTFLVTHHFDSCGGFLPRLQKLTLGFHELRTYYSVHDMLISLFEFSRCFSLPSNTKDFW